MSGDGRPLRFLAIVLALWVGARVYWLWPGPPVMAVRGRPVAAAERRIVMVATPASVQPDTVRQHQRSEAIQRHTPDVPDRFATLAMPVSRHHDAASTRDPIAVSPPPLPAPSPGIAVSRPVLIAAAPTTIDDDASPAPRRWSASGWAIVRAAGPGAGVATPQLGGSQAGIRIARTLDAAGRFAVAARVVGAIDTRQQEAAIGIEWRPIALPVRIVAERRIGIAGVKDGSAIGLVGGASTHAPGGIRVDGYAQAGAIVRDGTSGYADGAIRATRPVWRSTSGAMLEAGAGLWGAAQRGAHRLDIGPSAALLLPVGGVPRLRVAVEWRQRVVGDARPESGPALSIGADY